MTSSHQGVRLSILVFWITVLFLPGPLCPAEDDAPSAERAWLAWVREKAILLESSDWQDMDPGKLAFLDEALEGKRIIYLGEPDHYIKEKNDFRLIFIQYLFERGWNYLGMEGGQCDGSRVDRYLETGDRKHLEEMDILGSRGFRRPDRDYEMLGFNALKNEEFKERFKAAEIRFIETLRLFNVERSEGCERLHMFGFDMDVLPCGGYVHAQALLEPHRDTPLVREINSRMDLVPHESPREEKARLQKLRDFLEIRGTEVKALLGGSGAKKLDRILRELCRSLQFFEAAQAGPRGDQWLTTMKVRETWMFQRMDEMFETLPRDGKIILMGHNFHLSKQSDSLNFVGKNRSPRPMWDSIGTYLARRRPQEVYSIWMLYDRGQRGNIMLDSGFQKVKSDPRRIEHLMARAGSAFILPLGGADPRETYLDKTVNFVQNGRAGSGLLNQQADVLFFVDRVSIPEPPDPP